MHFNRDDSVTVEPIIMKEENRMSLENHLMLLYTGIQRSAAPILQAQSDNTADHVDTYKEMRDLAYKARDALSKGDIAELGAHMHRNWELKKTLEKQISSSSIDRTYELALKNGALGGKIIGAGGGGFLLLLAPPDKHRKLEGVMTKAGLSRQKVSIDYNGSRVIFVGQQKG